MNESMDFTHPFDLSPHGLKSAMKTLALSNDRNQCCCFGIKDLLLSLHLPHVITGSGA